MIAASSSCPSMTTDFTSYLLYRFVKPNTTGRLGAQRNIIPATHIAIPSYFISHAWKGGFVKLLESVLAFLSNAAGSVAVWLDFVAIDQHVSTNNAVADTFKATLHVSQAGTVVVVDMPTVNPGSRAWCLYEWNWTLHIHGPDGIHFVGMDTEQRGQVVQTIHVESAQAFSESDKKMILDEVLINQGSFEAFDSNLKRQLILDPISYNVDLKQLYLRSLGTKWLFGPIIKWMKESASPRALVIMGGAGEGKSSISAAICDQLFGMNPDRKIKNDESSYLSFPIAAAHFLKFSDARRLDTVKIIKSICFQLARQIPLFSEALLKLSAADVDKLTDFEAAYGKLLSLLPNLTDKTIFILIDAIDEADPIEQQLAGYNKDEVQIKPCGNRTMYMLASCLAPRLPSNFKFILTTRPDAMMSGVKNTLTRTFGAKGVMFIDDPSSLRDSSNTAASSENGKVMVFDYIYKNCKLDELGIPYPPCPSLNDTYDIYKAIFDANMPSEEHKRLLNVLVAAQEPLSVSLLESMSSAHLLTSLPGSTSLVFVQEHKVLFVHKSFIDWLRNMKLSGEHAVDEGQGHALLAMRLLKDVMSAADAKEGSPAIVASEYCLKYSLHHLCLAVASHKMDLSLLNHCLGKWEFLRQVFKSGNGDKILPALGHLESSLDSHSEESKRYLLDAISWIKHYLSDFMQKPDEMELLTIAPSNMAPLETNKYHEAVTRLQPTHYISKVLGDSRMNSNQWPADQLTFKASNLCMH